jgi:6-phosphofructo-2-kinase/fructose-2,6-biphosphatase
LLAKEKIISLQKNSSPGCHMRMKCQRQFFICVQTMPEAAGAVAAGAVADQLLGPREQRQLAIILVG